MKVYYLPLIPYVFCILTREYCRADDFGMNGIGDFVLPLRKKTIIMWVEKE